jgi:hypothetical protein
VLLLLLLLSVLKIKFWSYFLALLNDPRSHFVLNTELQIKFLLELWV